jgi:hypothetical protein
MNPRQLLAAAWHTRIASTATEQHQAQRCSTFVSSDGGATWIRHDFALVDCGDEQVAILADGQAVFIALAQAPGIGPARGSWLIVYHSSDGGITWDEQPTVINHGHDHAAVVVDTHSPTRKGWIYITTHYQWRDGNGRLSSSAVSHSRCGDSPVDIGAARLFPTYGDYYGIVTNTDGAFRVLWPDMHDGHSVLLTTSINVAPD